MNHYGIYTVHCLLGHVYLSACMLVWCLPVMFVIWHFVTLLLFLTLKLWESLSICSCSIVWDKLWWLLILSKYSRPSEFRHLDTTNLLKNTCMPEHQMTESLMYNSCWMSQAQWPNLRVLILMNKSCILIHRIETS